MDYRARPKKPVRYALGFASTAVVLGALTLLMVLVVLPRRYVLHAGLRESGMSFPASAAPFSPPEELRREVVPPPPILAPAVVVRGPAELFWEEIGGLLRAERFSDALPRFRDYLERYPRDRSVRREYAVTLDRAGRAQEAVPVLQTLLEEMDDTGLRLVLARSLRDQGRLDEASAQYEILGSGAPDDTALTLEWARALSWGRRYDESASVLEASLTADPDDEQVRVELARILYWSGRVEEAAEVVAVLSDEAVNRLEASTLRDDIVAANTPPPPPPEEIAPLTLLGEGKRAAAQEDYGTAAQLMQQALDETPGDPEALSAYADLLQFQLEDLEGARLVLLRLEVVEEAPPTRRMRLAQLAVWTGRNDEAVRRLEDLLADVPLDPPPGEGSEEDFTGAQIAAARALRGDLYRWEGHRGEAALSYEQALGVDPGSPGARAGLAELNADIDRRIKEVEAPRLGTTVYSFSDSDDFTRLDLGLEGVVMDGRWVWNARSGVRVLQGLDSSGRDATERGVFAEVEGARWWRWGTLRTAVHVGVEETRPNGTDLSLGASLHWSELGGFRMDVRFDHGPAYPLTVTLQSALARVQQDRLTVTMARELSRKWSLSLTGDVARLDVPESGDATEPDGSIRLEAGVSLARPVTSGLVLGLAGRALTYTDGAPDLGERRLFWDPESVISTGVYAQWTSPGPGPWALRARLAPSVAFIRERGDSGSEGVPHSSAEAGLTWTGSRLRTSLDAFYYQGRFEGYRAYGLRFGLSMTDWLGGGGSR